VKPDYPREGDAIHQGHVAAQGEDWGNRMLQLRERNYWRNAGKVSANVARQSLTLVQQITSGLTLTQQQQSWLAQLEANVVDLEATVADDPQPSTPASTRMR
jgi:hypothetical protein